MRIRYDAPSRSYQVSTPDRRDVEGVLDWCVGQFGRPVAPRAFRTQGAQPRWTFRLEEPPVMTVDPLAMPDDWQDAFELTLQFSNPAWERDFRDAWRG